MTAINMLAAAIVLVRGLFFVLNNMRPETGHGIRITWVLLTTGAAAVLLLDHAPTWPSVVFHIGIAAMVCIDRSQNFFRGLSHDAH